MRPESYEGDIKGEVTQKQIKNYAQVLCRSFEQHNITDVQKHNDLSITEEKEEKTYFSFMSLCHYVASVHQAYCSEN